MADCIRAGCIGPCIYNDEVFIPSLRKLGIPLEHARDYTSDGCWEPHVQGRTDFRHGWVSVAEALDRVLSPANWEEVEVPVYIEAMDPFRGLKAPDPYRFTPFDKGGRLVLKSPNFSFKSRAFQPPIYSFTPIYMVKLTR